MPASDLRRLLESDRAAIMGIVNTTPDSFSDGGRFLQADRAIEHGLDLVKEGANILDVGGESTRPGAAKVAEQEELDRVIPVIEGLVSRTDVPISIDTCKPEVMQQAIAAGASMVNDVNALRAPHAVKTVAAQDVVVCLMHMLGTPDTMQEQPSYTDVVSEVGQFLLDRVRVCEDAGVSKENIVLDPGIGFGKTISHNLLLLNSVPELIQNTDCPMLIGVSRKSFIGKVLDRETDQRLHGSIGLAVQAAINGAKILRVHDVAASVDAIRIAEAVSHAH
ncbi:MAG: dihydropteroate synthase [Pseudomonadota bacterium]